MHKRRRIQGEEKASIIPQNFIQMKVGNILSKFMGSFTEEQKKKTKRKRSDELIPGKIISHGKGAKTMTS